MTNSKGGTSCFIPEQGSLALLFAPFSLGKRGSRWCWEDYTATLTRSLQSFPSHAAAELSKWRSCFHDTKPLIWSIRINSLGLRSQCTISYLFYSFLVLLWTETGNLYETQHKNYWLQPASTVTFSVLQIPWFCSLLNFLSCLINLRSRLVD